jgi:hypothetical protein
MGPHPVVGALRQGPLTGAGEGGQEIGARWGGQDVWGSARAISEQASESSLTGMHRDEGGQDGGGVGGGGGAAAGI